MTVTVSPTEQQQWIRTRDNRTGRQLFVAVPSGSRPGVYHLVSLAGCDCREFSYRQTCSHLLAVRAEAAKVAQAPAREAWLPTETAATKQADRLARKLGLACTTCGKCHTSEADRRASHIAQADALWGSDGN